MTHPYGYDPDWYSDTIRPEFVPVAPDGALELVAELKDYARKFPSYCVKRPEHSLPFDTVDCLIPGFGVVTYLYMEQLSLTVFVTDDERDYERVYRYLFLDQSLEEEEHAVHHLRSTLRRHSHYLPTTEILSRMEGDVLCNRRGLSADDKRRRRQDEHLHPERQRLQLHPFTDG